MAAHVFRTLAVAGLGAFGLAACDSQRFVRDPFSAAPPPPPRVAAPAPLEPAQPAVPPAGAVIAEPLPPPTVPGLGQPAPQSPTQPGSAAPPGPTIPAVSPGPAPESPRPQLAALPPPTVPATAPPPAPAPGTPPAAGTVTRTTLTGGWAARDGAGGSCRVLLSGTPSLDLYKASASACANKDLAKVNAWELRGGEIYLYSAGAVVARLQSQGGGRTASGALVRTGAPLTMTK